MAEIVGRRTAIPAVTVQKRATGHAWPVTVEAEAESYRTAHSDDGLTVGKVRPVHELFVTVNRPVEGGYRSVRAQLISAVHCNGELHHFRVSLGDGVLLLAHPHWLTPASMGRATAAGLGWSGRTSEAENRRLARIVARAAAKLNGYADVEDWA